MRKKKETRPDEELGSGGMHKERFMQKLQGRHESTGKKRKIV